MFSHFITFLVLGAQDKYPANLVVFSHMTFRGISLTPD